MFLNSSQTYKRETLSVIVMTVIIVVIFSPVLSNGFLTNWDDQWMVTGNIHLQESGFQAVQAMFSEPYGGQYSPLNTLAYWVIVQAGGMEPFGFQMVFLAIHLFNFLLVGLVLKKLLDLIPDINLSGRWIPRIAWATAFLFAIHPMQVEAVAWISASKVVLYSFFYLLGLLLYLIYKQTGRTRYMFGVLFCFVASLLAKEQAVVFVLSLILVDMVTYSGLKNESFWLPKMWLEKLPFLFAALLFGWYTISISELSGAGGEAYPFGQRILFANYSFWEYIVKLTVPHSLSHIYFFPMNPGEAVPLRLWFYPLATGFFLWLCLEFRRYINKIYLFGGLFFLINIAVVLHIIPVPREAIIADRYVYLSVIGFSLVMVYTVRQWYLKGTRLTRVSVVFAGMLFLLVLAGYTNQRVQAWENMTTLNESVRPLIEKHLGRFEAEAINIPPPCSE